VHKRHGETAMTLCTGDVIASGMCMGAVGIIGNGGRNRPIVDRNDDVMTRRTSLSSLFLLLLA